MMPHERRFRRLVRSMLARGIKPTPTVINRYLGRTGRRRMNMLNGRETTWRREELLAAGWTEPTLYQDQRPNGEFDYPWYSRWSPPR